MTSDPPEDSDAGPAWNSEDEPRPSSPSLSHAIIDLLGEQRRALHAAAIASHLGVRQDFALHEELDGLVGDGIVIVQPGRRYRLAPQVREHRGDLVEGLFHSNPKGFGFVKLGAADDVFVPAEAIAGALHGDRVQLRVVARSRRGREGEIVAVLERGRQRVVGVIRGRARQRRLEPDDSRVRGPIEIVDDQPAPATEGDSEPPRSVRAGRCAVVELTRFPDRHDELPQGRITAVLGTPGEPDVEVAKVLIEHNIGETHPPEALAEAAAFGTEPSAAELATREDLTAIPLITIDPHDARDHDDAIWAERDDHGAYQAWVAIADVSHYVTPGSALDETALQRGTSVYLPDRAVPMLPPTLSSTLCSLLPGVERLCLCVHLHIDPTGKVRKTRIIEGKMRSRAFLSYQSVARALGFTTEPPRDPEAEALRHELRVIWDLVSQLRKRRMRRGALDLNLPEVTIELDEQTGAPVGVSQRSHDPGVHKAYRIVEELMLLANESVAKALLGGDGGRGIPAIYRIHGTPDEEKLDRFAAQCAALGLDFDAEAGATPKGLSKFARKIAAHPKQSVLHGLLLRALKQACYDPNNIGHFGLASEAYLHFTSPIRRYPDLAVHRILRRTLRGERVARDAQTLEALQQAAQTASQQERNAMAAERQVADVYRCLYMLRHVGDIVEGTVTAITPGGVYLRVDDPFVDVRVLLNALGREEYEIDELSLHATAWGSGDTVALGDSITVEIEDVALQRRTIYGRRILDPSARRGRATKKQRRQQRQGAAKAARSSRKRRSTGRKPRRGRR
ncbi:MAG: VacB/RNase II family 3'-5' exoribonuclease [Deltaproteobacteria bacterium]|nr:VacB/RNase II family 3'-5' exoribonuclease [Deltaproteobacteria bacterium]